MNYFSLNNCLLSFFTSRCSSLTEQKTLLSLLWCLWSDLPMYGHKAAQFVDLLGYFTLKTPDHSERKVYSKIYNKQV